MRGSLLKALPAVLALLFALSYGAYASINDMASNNDAAQTDLQQLASEPGVQAHNYELKQANSKARMSKQEAIDKAKTYIAGGYDSEHAASVKAVFTAFTDNETPRLPEKDILLKDLPVWIVTFDGLKIEGHGPLPAGDSAKEAKIHTQLHVVIDDNSGEVLEAFSYK